MTRDHPRLSLKARSISATLWSGADVLSRQGLQFVVSIALARLLGPEEFGTVGALLLFTGIASVFVDGGFSAALVQRQEVSHLDESTVFWINLLMGAAVALGLWGCGPAIAAFYGAPVLEPVTTMLAVNILLSALGSIHGTLLTKQLDFRTQVKVGVIAVSLSGGVAVFTAWLGFGVWALVAQTLTASAVSTCLLWTFCAWRPRMEFSVDSARRLFRYGGYLMLSALLDVAYTRLHTLLIGRLYGLRELGLYSRAEGVKQLPAGVLTGILSRVAFPVFSEASRDRETLRRGVRHALRGMMLLNVPAMLGMLATADALVFTLFGAQWMAAVPVLRVLCLSGLLWPLHVVNLNALMAMGHSKLFFRLELIKKVLGVLLLAAGSVYGVTGIAWSQVIFGLIAFPINAYFTRRYLDYGPLAQSRDVMAIIFVACVMAILTYALGELVQVPSASRLTLQVGFGILLFVILCMIFRLRAFEDARALVRRRSPVHRANAGE